MAGGSVGFLLADVRAWSRDWRAWLLLVTQVTLGWLDAAGILERASGSETWEYLVFVLVLAVSVVLGRPTLSFLLTIIALAATVVSLDDLTSSHGLSLLGASTLSGILVTALAAYVGRSRARAERRASLIGAEGFFDRTFTQHRLPMMVMDATDGRIVAANPAAETFYGYPAGTLTTLTVWDISASDEDIVRQRLRAMTQGAAGPFEAPHRLADGSTRIVEVIGAPAGAEGEDLVVLTVHDVTASAQYRSELAESRDLLAATLEAEPDFHAVFEPVRDEVGTIVDLRYVEANNVACAALGRPREQLLGRLLSEVLPDLVRSPRFAEYRRVAETGEHLLLEQVPALDDVDLIGFGAWLDVLVYPAGNFLSIVIHDATNRVEAADELARSREDYRLLSDMSGDVVFRTVDGAITYVSPAVTRLLGWSPQELLGTHGAIEVHPEDHAEVIQARERPSLDGLVTYVARLRRKDRTYVYCEVQSRAVDGSDALNDVIGSIRDVTLRMAERNERQRAMENLHRTMSALPDAWVVARAIYDRNGDIEDFAYEDANELAAAWHGLSRAELLSSTVVGVEGPRGRDDVDAVSGALLTGQLIVLDDVPSFVAERQGRGRVWLDIRVAPLPGDRILYSWRDVTERHQAAEALEESERRFRLLVDNDAD